MNGSKQTTSRLAMAALAATLMAPADALAQEDDQDFVFNVPLEVSNLHHSVEQIVVRCIVSGLDDLILGMELAFINVAEGEPETTTAILSLNAGDGLGGGGLLDLEPALATDYRCDFAFVMEGGAPKAASSNTLPALVRPAPGTPLTYIVEGPIESGFSPLFGDQVDVQPDQGGGLPFGDQVE